MKLYLALAVLLPFIFLISKVNRNNSRNIVLNSNKTIVVQDSTKTKVKHENIGIGPIKELKLGPINKKLAEEGEGIFNSKCSPCHTLDNKLVGPPLRNITKEVPPIYIMNYLLNTAEMQKKEPQVQDLIKKYNGIVMPDQGLKEKEARALVEYFRSVAN